MLTIKIYFFAGHVLLSITGALLKNSDAPMDFAMLLIISATAILFFIAGIFWKFKDLQLAVEILIEENTQLKEELDELKQKNN